MSNLITNEENIKYIYNVSKGSLKNGAKKLKDFDFVSNIGGVNYGSSEINISIKDSCAYYLALKYVSYQPNLSFKIKINGIEDLKVYYSNFSTQWSINIPLTITIPIVLKKGNNTIIFYGDGNNKTPYIGEFEIILPPVTNYLYEGIIENNAYVNSSTNFLSAIGGPNDGASTVTVKVTKDEMYNLTFEYVIYDQTKPLKLTINGIENKNIYYIPLAKDGNIDKIQTFTVPINLNSGNNTIKFHGDGFNYGPSLGRIFINSLSTSKTSLFAATNNYKISSGTLGNGAYFYKSNTWVINVGGSEDGYVTVKVPIEVYGDYLLKLNYTNNNDSILKIDINGIEFDTIYNIKTNKTGIFSVTLPLVAGVNKLKFHGDGINKSPEIGDFSLELIKDKSSSAFPGNVFNQAKFLAPGIISDLGGTEDGLYIFKYDAQYWGQYALYVTVDTSEKSILVIDTNNKSKGLTYEIEMSDSVSVKVIPVFLVKGINNIVFHGDYINKTPNILKIEIKLMLTSKDSIYNLTEGVLGGGAILDENKKLVTNLGGIDDGFVEIKITITNPNWYNLDINYLPQIVDSTLKIDITGDKNFSSNTICVLSGNKTDKKSVLQNYRATVQLTKGINNIRFHGNELDKVPDLSYIEISELLINTVTLPSGAKVFSKTYSIKNSEVDNGVKLVKLLNNFIRGVGGPDNKSAYLFIKLPRDAEYKIDIKYLKINDNEKFKVSFNLKGTGEIYNPPKTKSLKEEDAKIFTINMFLTTDTQITIYGDGINNAPFIGDITITEIKLDSKEYWKINDIKLDNGAKKYSENDFINSIGGPRGGVVILSIYSNIFGWYNLGFKYMCAINGRNLNVYVNKRQVKSYVFAITEDWQVINAQTFTIPVLLLEGNNIIRLEGDGDNFAPIIGKFNMEINSKMSTLNYNIASGTLKNSAKININGLVTNIGGPKSGEVLVKVNVRERGIYELSIECVPIENKSFLEIFINDIVYNVEFDKIVTSWSLSDIPVLKTRVLLLQGENIITFRGSQIPWNYAGFLGRFYLTLDGGLYSSRKNLPKDSYDITKGTLENGAFILENFVTGLGGMLEGAVSIVVTVNNYALYSMNIEYRAEERSFLMIDTNGEFDGKIYVFTSSLDCNDTNIQEVTLRLIKGKNTIKFYGLKHGLAPNLNIISLRVV